MNSESVIQNQKRINSLMSRYEDVTRTLLDCDIDNILILTEKRSSISSEITKLDKEIRNECGNTEALEAYLNKCGRNELSEELKQVFDLRQEFNSIAFRVSSLEPEIKERIRMLRDELIVKIKKNNSGQNAKAAKYANAGMTFSEGLYIPENKKMI